MAKQLKKKTKTSVTSPVTPSVTPPVVTPSGYAVMWGKYFPYIITSLFFILSFVGILHHELWRDEYQAWMVAVDAHSLPELFRNLKYEGHPPLWHLFLFVISAFTDNPIGMQLFHILISTCVIFLFNRFSPFLIIQKILFSFGYYIFYEYNLISRGYVLGLLLIVIFCILYKNRQKYILLMGAVLFLLANNTIFGVILTVCFSGILLLEGLFPDKKRKGPKIPFNHLVLLAVIAFSGAIVGYLLIRPEPDNSFPTLYVTNFDLVRANLAFSRLIYAYFSFPDFLTFHFWNTNFFVPDESKFSIAITPLLFLAWIIAFMRYRLIVILYCVGTVILFVFYYYTGLVWSRYAGHLFLLLIACCWLVYYQREKPYKNKLINKLSLVGNRIRTPFLVLILSIHFCGGVASYIMDLKYPFSTSAQAADYIRDNHLMEYEMIGSKDYIVSPLVSQLGRKILYAERREYGSFIIYDQKRMNIWSFSEVQSFVRDMVAKGNKRIILVKSSPILKTYDDTGESEPWIEGMMTDDLNLRLLTTIDPGIVEDEVYYIYSVDKVK